MQKVQPMQNVSSNIFEKKLCDLCINMLLPVCIWFKTLLYSNKLPTLQLVLYLLEGLQSRCPNDIELLTIWQIEMLSSHWLGDNYTCCVLLHFKLRGVCSLCNEEACYRLSVWLKLVSMEVSPETKLNKQSTLGYKSFGGSSQLAKGSLTSDFNKKHGEDTGKVMVFSLSSRHTRCCCITSLPLIYYVPNLQYSRYKCQGRKQAGSLGPGDLGWKPIY